jgi:hypothetical protein
MPSFQNPLFCGGWEVCHAATERTNASAKIGFAYGASICSIFPIDDGMDILVGVECDPRTYGRRLELSRDSAVKFGNRIGVGGSAWVNDWRSGSGIIQREWRVHKFKSVGAYNSFTTRFRDQIAESINFSLGARF